MLQPLFVSRGGAWRANVTSSSRYGASQPFFLGGYHMTMPQWIKPGIFGAVVGAIALMQLMDLKTWLAIALISAASVITSLVSRGCGKS